MRVDLYQQKTANLFAENRLLKFAMAAMVAVSLVNWNAARNALDSTKTVIVPVGARGMLEVSTASASDDYLRAMARYITHQLGTYTASTARHQFEEVLALFAPEHYAAAKHQFESLAEHIERYPNVASLIHWTGQAPLKRAEDKLIISALKRRLVNGNTARADSVMYEIHYALREGRFWILNIKEHTDESH